MTTTPSRLIKYQTSNYAENKPTCFWCNPFNFRQNRLKWKSDPVLCSLTEHYHDNIYSDELLWISKPPEKRDPERLEAKLWKNLQSLRTANKTKVWRSWTLGLETVDILVYEKGLPMVSTSVWSFNSLILTSPSNGLSLVGKKSLR